MSVLIETARLLLREQTEADLAALLAVVGDEITMRYYPRPFTAEEALSWIRRNIRRYADYGFGLWAVVVRETGQMVGQVGLAPQRVDGREEIEVGWQINRRVWRRGYATEAARAARDWAFANTGLDHLISLIRPINEASAAVAAKLGMRPDRETIYAGLPHDVWQLTRAEWLAQFGPASEGASS